jgi:hypothetical protein
MAYVMKAWVIAVAVFLSMLFVGCGSAGAKRGDSGLATDASTSGGATTGGNTGHAGTAANGGATSTGGVVSTGGTVTPGNFLNGFFVIGTFMPTIPEFKKWKDRGVNTLVAEAGAADLTTIIQQWNDKARSMGLKMIRRPLPNPSDDIGNADLLAWMQDDEPDASGQGFVNIPACTTKYNSWRQIDPARPVYINFGGGDVSTAMDGPAPSWCPSPYTNCLLTSTYKSLIAAADWLSNDFYPVTGYVPSTMTRGDLTIIGLPMDRLKTWADKPLFNYIETSSQHFIANTRGVTPDELRVEIWLSIIHGVRGYVFFPQVVGGTTTNDGTPDDVAAEMTRVNALVTQIAPALQGNINPPEIGAAPPAPLQAGWRNAPDGMYFIVVNPIATPTTAASITLTGLGGATKATVLNEGRTVPISNGTISDSFGAFAVHIYVVAK